MGKYRARCLRSCTDSHWRENDHVSTCKWKNHLDTNPAFFTSSQGDGPMCRPEVALPDQTSDGDFQVGIC